MAGKTNKPAPAAEPYKRTPEDDAGVKAYLERKKARGPLPKLRVVVSENGVVEISSEYGDEPVAAALQMNALGLTLPTEFTALIKSLVNLTARGGKPDAAALNEHLSLIAGIAPTNTTEAMLAVQMAAVHSAAMDSAERLRRVTLLDQAAHHAKVFNNLTRTFAMQAETLKKLRSTGEQKVVVEHQHVHVHPGGQAVVGTLHQGGEGVAPQLEHQPHVRSIPERETVLGSVQANGPAMPRASGEGLERLSLPRRSGRRAARAG